MWLLANNKLLTRDNLGKRQDIPYATCVFCSKLESCHHLFFGCAIAVEFWKDVSRLVGYEGDINTMSFSSCWSRGERFAAINIIHAVGLWAIWKTRNDMVFNYVAWPGMQAIWRKTALNLSTWGCLTSGHIKGRLERCAAELELLARSPPLLTWPDPG